MQLWQLGIGFMSLCWLIRWFNTDYTLLQFINNYQLGYIILGANLLFCWIGLQIYLPISIHVSDMIWQHSLTLLHSSFIQSAISLTPEQGIRLGLHDLSLLWLFLLSFYYGLNRYLTKKLFLIIRIVILIYSVYGLFIQLGNYHTILWFTKWAYPNDLTSTFVNRNHFATYIGFGLIITIGLWMQAALQVESRQNKRFNQIGLIIQQNSLFLASISLLFTALFLTHSRAGIFCSVIGILSLILFFNLKMRWKFTQLIYLKFALFLIIFWISYFSYQGLLFRLQQQSLIDYSRLQVYQIIIKSILIQPFTGFGYGSFATVFPLWKNILISGDFSKPSLWNYAHNSYLEMIFELGLPISIMIIYLMLKINRICYASIQSRKRDWIYPMMTVSISILIALHALVDFSIQIPAITYYYTIILGLGYAQSFSSRYVHH